LTKQRAPEVGPRRVRSLLATGPAGERVLEATSDERVVLELPPRPEYVGVARMVASAFARHHAFGEEQIDDVKIAVSEAVTNAVRAHLDAGVEEPVMLTATMDGDGMVLAITDRGAGFDPESIPAFGSTPLPGSLEGGLGLTVIRSLIAETRIERQPDGGMRLSLLIKREGEPAESYR
jgi:serine/threonine-protein kinase RsbW